jgi:hypothetical protein
LVEQVFRRRAAKLAWFARWRWLWVGIVANFIANAVAFVLPKKVAAELTAVTLIAYLLYVLAFWASWKWGRRAVIPAYRSTATNFWSRNRDGLVVTVVGGLLVAMVAAVAGPLIVIWITTKH